MPVGQFLLDVPGGLLHDHVGAVGEQDGIVVVIILPVLCIALQGGRVSVRPASRISVPGDGQAALQADIPVQIGGCLPFGPLQGLLICPVTCKPRLRSQQLLLVAVHVIIVQGKLAQGLFRVSSRPLLSRPIKGVKELHVVVCPVLFLLKERRPASRFRRKEDRLHSLREIFLGNVLTYEVPGLIRVQVLQVALQVELKGELAYYLPSLAAVPSEKSHKGGKGVIVHRAVGICPVVLRLGDVLGHFDGLLDGPLLHRHRGFLGAAVLYRYGLAGVGETDIFHVGTFLKLRARGIGAGPGALHLD